MTPATLAPPRTKVSSTVTLTIARQSLKTALARLSGSVGSGIKALPVTHHVRLDVAPGSLILTATDFDSWARLTISCDADGDATALLPAKRLAEIVGALPPVGAVTLSLTNDRAVLTAGRSRFELSGLAVSEFPDAPHHDDSRRVTVKAAAFLDAVARVAPHASTAESRPAINTIRVESANDTLAVCAIDGARIARLVVPATPGSLACSLHRFAAPVLARLFSTLSADATLSLSADGARFVIASDDATAIVRLVEDPFPAYQHFFTNAAPNRVVVFDRLVLTAALRRVALVTDETNRVELVLADEITVRATGTDIGKASDAVAIDEQRGDQDRTPRTVALNASYAVALLDTLGTASVALTIDAPERPVLLVPADANDPAIALIMPLRI